MDLKQEPAGVEARLQNNQLDSEPPPGCMKKLKNVMVIIDK